MAIIQIPVGGQAVGVEVPDFAMDTTLRELLNEVRQQTSTLAGGLSTLTATTSDSKRSADTRGNNREATLLNHLNKVGQFIQNTVPGARIASQAVSSAANSVNTLADSAKLSDALEKGLLSKLPLIGSYLQGFGEAIANPVKILEQMSQSLNNFIQVGGSASMSMIEMKNSAAAIGLELQDFSVLVGDSGKTIAALGGNTTEGTKRLIELVSTLRSVTQDIAYLGMSSSEMAQYMVDELEARRRLSSTMDLQAMDAQQLSAVLKERYINEAAVARLTGQDVRDRMAAQMNYQMSLAGSGVMAQLQTQQQREAASAAVSSFSQFGANQAMMEDLYNRQMSMGSFMAGVSNEIASQVSLMMSAGLDIQSFMLQQDEATRSGNVEMAQALTNQFASQMKNLVGTPGQAVISNLAMLNVEGATGAAEAMFGTITANASAIDSFTDQIIAQREQIYNDMQKGLYQFAALQTTYEQVQARATAVRDSLEVQKFGINAGNESAAGAGLVTVLTTANKALETTSSAITEIGIAQNALIEELKSQLGIEGSVTSMFTTMTQMIEDLNGTISGMQAYLSGIRAESRN